MKKIYNLLALVILFTFAGSAQAIYWEKTGGDPTIEPEAGQPYFIMPGSADYYADNAYLSSTGEITTTLATSEQNVWYFEAANEGKWKIYCLIDGEKHYLAKAANAGQGFVTTTNSRINEITLGEAVYAADATEAGDMGVDYFTTKEDADPSVEVLIIDIAGSYLYKNGAKGGWNSAASNANTWYLLPAQKMSGTNYLDAVINEMFPDGFDPDAYSVGINPGDYSEDALNALVEAYENANAGSTDDAECIELANALRAAYDAMVASFVNFGEGYYIFTTYRTSIGAMFDNTNNVSGAKNNMYTTTDPAIAITHTTTGGSEFSIGAWDVYDPENDEAWMSHAAAPYFIWKVIKSDKEGMYYIQNWKTGRYIGTPGANKASNTPIPTVEEPNAAFNMAPAAYKNDAGETCWTFYSDELTKKSAWGGGWDMGGLHAPGDVLNMVTWDSTKEGSCWYPRTITTEMLDQITELNKQATLNFNLTSLVDEVETAIENAKIYAIFDTATGKPAEGLNNVESLLTEEGIADGLVYDVAQLYTNAQEQSEGPIENLIDGNLDTFFHTAWQSGGAPNTVIVVDPETDEEVEVYPPHYLSFDLLEQPQEAVTVVWYTRTGKPADRPVGLMVYASNDETEESEVDGIYKEWTEIGENEFHWDLNNKVVLGGSEVNNYVGVMSANLGAKYRYVRIDFVTTGGNSGNYGKFTNAAEVRVYGGMKYEYKYDEENSPYEGVPAAIKNALNEKLELAKTELEDELATQPTIDALQAAYDNFKNNLPDPTTVQNLVKEALAQADAAEEGTGVGYFAVGAADELRAVANSINVTGTSSVEEILAALNKIKAAIAAFNAKLNKPVNGKYYYVKSATSAGETWFNGLSEEEQTEENENRKVTNYADNDFIGTRNAEGFNVAWGAEELTDDIEDYLGYVWQSETNADGTFSLKHVLTGYYMGGYEKNNENVELVPADKKGKFTYQSAKVAGVVNIVFAEGIYMNAQPGTNNVVTWNSASGLDNSAFSFEDAEALKEGSDYIIDLSSAYGLRVMTLPVAVTIPTKGTVAYEVLGVKGEGENATLELKALTGAIEAGKPFIFDPDGFAEAAFEGVKLGAVAEGKNANGVQGVLVDTELNQDGFLVIQNQINRDKDGEVTGVTTNAVLADKGQWVSAGRGFFSKEIPTTTATGDLSLACPDGVPTALASGIESIITRVAGKASFDLQGRRVQSTEKGLYIINGNKVIVK